MEGKNRNLLVCWFNFPFNSCKMVGKGFFLRGSFFLSTKGNFFLGRTMMNVLIKKGFWVGL